MKCQITILTFCPSKWGNLACKKSQSIPNDKFLAIESHRAILNKQNRLQDNFLCALWRPQYTKYCTSFLPPKSTQKKFPYKNFTYLRGIAPLPKNAKAQLLSPILWKKIRQKRGPTCKFTRTDCKITGEPRDPVQKFKKHINVEDCPHLFGGERMRWSAFFGSSGLLKIQFQNSISKFIFRIHF